MTEIMPFPENNYETVLLDRPERVDSFHGGPEEIRLHFHSWRNEN